ncbi:hypothetical protein ACVI9W_004394 [Pseudomonas sp. 210_17 TE3656]
MNIESLKEKSLKLRASIDVLRTRGPVVMNSASHWSP